MSIGEHQYSSFFQRIQLNNLFLFSQDFTVNSGTQQANGTLNVFQFVNFDALNIYFGFIDYSINTFSSPFVYNLPNPYITQASTFPPRDTMFGIYKGVFSNELDFANAIVKINIKPSVFATSGGTPI
jgi:hypothetical protein